MKTIVLILTWRQVNNRTMLFALNYYPPDPLAPRKNQYNLFHIKLSFK